MYVGTVQCTLYKLFRDDNNIVQQNTISTKFYKSVDNIINI